MRRSATPGFCAHSPWAQAHGFMASLCETEPAVPWPPKSEMRLSSILVLVSRSGSSTLSPSPMSRHKFFPLLISFALLLCFCTFFSFAADNPKKIVLIAGPITGHPKEAHEYEKNVILLKQLLDTSPDLQGKVRVEAPFQGWPNDPSTLDDADTIFLTSDGTDRDEKNHPLYVGDHLQAVARQMKRGCGLVFFHWTTFNPVRFHDQITEWVGGYLDYETRAGPNHRYSPIHPRKAEAKLGTQQHP